MLSKDFWEYLIDVHFTSPNYSNQREQIWFVLDVVMNIFRYVQLISIQYSTAETICKILLINSACFLRRKAESYIICLSLKNKYVTTHHTQNNEQYFLRYIGLGTVTVRMRMSSSSRSDVGLSVFNDKFELSKISSWFSSSSLFCRTLLRFDISTTEEILVAEDISVFSSCKFLRRLLKFAKGISWSDRVDVWTFDFEK